MSGDRPYDVFLCYNSADRAIVETIAEGLRDVGVKAWYDRWNIIPGTTLGTALTDALQSSATTAAFIGPSGQGPWQDNEINAALELSTRDTAFRVIPVVLPGAEPPPLLLRTRVWVSFATVDDKDAFELLLRGIRGEAAVATAPLTELRQIEATRLDSAYLYGDYLLQLLNFALSAHQRSQLVAAIRQLPGLPGTWTGEQLAGHLAEVDRQTSIEQMSGFFKSQPPQVMAALQLGCSVRSLVTGLIHLGGIATADHIRRLGEQISAELAATKPPAEVSVAVAEAIAIAGTATPENGATVAGEVQERIGSVMIPWLGTLTS